MIDLILRIYVVAIGVGGCLAYLAAAIYMVQGALGVLS